MVGFITAAAGFYPAQCHFRRWDGIDWLFRNSNRHWSLSVGTPPTLELCPGWRRLGCSRWHDRQICGRAEGFFLPGILSGALTALLCLVSVRIKRPLVAWISYITRRWPLEWYWHSKVCPANVTSLLAGQFFYVTYSASI